MVARKPSIEYSIIHSKDKFEAEPKADIFHAS
jgi:hypothetical protein